MIARAYRSRRPLPSLNPTHTKDPPCVACLPSPPRSRSPRSRSSPRVAAQADPSAAAAGPAPPRSTDRGPAGRPTPSTLDLQRPGQRGLAGRLHRLGLGPRADGLPQLHQRLRRQRHRLPGHRPADRRQRQRVPNSTRHRTAARTPICRSWRAARRSRIRSGRPATWSDNLRLSGQTLAKIFTDEITNWDDPAITKDNNGHFWLTGGAEVTSCRRRRSSRSCTPKVRVPPPSSPSTSTPSSRASGARSPSPVQRTGRGTGQGLHRVLAAVGQPDRRERLGRRHQLRHLGRRQRRDRIRRVLLRAEYAVFGCVNGWPTALLENKAGYFTAPTQYNVAVALTKAQINLDKNSPNYLLSSSATSIRTLIGEPMRCPRTPT